MSLEMILILAAVAFVAYDYYREQQNPGSSLIFSHFVGTAS